MFYLCCAFYALAGIPKSLSKTYEALNYFQRWIIQQHLKSRVKQSQKVCTCQVQEAVQIKSVRERTFKLQLYNSSKSKSKGSEMESSTCFWPFVMSVSRCPTAMPSQFLNALKLG